MTDGLTAREHKIAIVRARWHADIVDRCVDSFILEWKELDGRVDDITVIDVPGAFEIPLQAKVVARSGRFSAVVGCAFVVDGGIYRHDFVASTVLNGMMQVQLESNVPVLSAVLTPHHFQETETHWTFFKNHFEIKGKEAANACRSILETRKRGFNVPSAVPVAEEDDDGALKGREAAA